MEKLSLSKLLANGGTKATVPDDLDKKMSELTSDILCAQQGIWHGKKRAVIVFEGFDAAGKGGVIRRLVAAIDPRGVHVYPIGAPTPEEQATHYLYRFWKRLPGPGIMAVFDRSWYGRVLVERVENLTPSNRIEQAYAEINEFERQLTNDGVTLIKIFLAISKKEQGERFEERLKDPEKQWKLTMDDVKARGKWNEYVSAVDEMLAKTHTESAPWYLIPADSKKAARLIALTTIRDRLKEHVVWMSEAKQKHRVLTLRKALDELGAGAWED